MSPSVSRFKLNTHSKHTCEDPQRVDLPVFFLALLLWGRGSSTGKAVQTLEETVQVIYFSLQTVCFNSVEKFHPHPPKKCVPSEGPGWFCCLLSPRDWYFVCWLKCWNSEFPLGFVMFGLAYSASSLRTPDRKLARVHVWLHHVCGAAQNPPPPCACCDWTRQ